MKKSRLWLGLAIGAALGTAIGYVISSNKKEEWLDEMANLVDKVKDNVNQAISKGKKALEDTSSKSL